MTKGRIFFVVLIALVAAASQAQWMSAYEKGLRAARTNDWAEARISFQQAIAYRPEDASGPTTMPGPVTERRQWRDGAAYSPNFLAAYCEYRLGLAAKGGDEKSLLQTSASEFETLLTKGQSSKETFYYLEQIYTKLGDTAKRIDIEARYASAKPKFRVDTEVVAPEDRALITGTPAAGGRQGTGPQVTIIHSGQAPIPGPNLSPSNNSGAIAPAVGPVPVATNKFALVIGNSTSQLKSGAVGFGADDAQAIREALVMDAGYSEANVDLVLNTTSAQLLASAKALADRIPNDATIFFYFAGNGCNINGKDYLAGVDSSSDTDSSAMTAKMDIYQLFMAKGAKVFAFFESPRPIANGSYFGKEIPMVGQMAQVQATIPGDGVSSEVHNGRALGIFTYAIVSALHEIRSNRIPIMEFGWQVFNRSRGGGTTANGIGARQVPTLPVLTHLSDQDRF